jgi:hypothetical protein
MSRRSHKDAKSKRERGQFLAVPFTVLHSRVASDNYLGR